jgi:hypothetical protein
MYFNLHVFYMCFICILYVFFRPQVPPDARVQRASGLRLHVPRKWLKKTAKKRFKTAQNSSFSYFHIKMTSFCPLLCTQDLPIFFANTA